MATTSEPDGCPNCGAEGAGRFCPECGQDNRRDRLRARAVLVDALQNLIGWESALVRTLRGLVLEPGATAADYVAGRRRRYVNPARFALLSLALWFVVTKLFGLDPMEVSGIKITNTSGGAETLIRDIREFIGRNLELLLYLALPLRALLLRLFFKGSGRNLAECLVLVLFIAGCGYLVGALLTPLHLLGLEWASPLKALLVVVWSIRGAHGFFGETWFATVWRLLCVSFLHAVGTVLFFALISVPWVLWIAR